MKEIWAEGRLGKRTGGRPRVIFGQVHEDASCELAAAAEVATLNRCLVIGSAGCTAFTLLHSGAVVVDAVDINPAQIHLIEAKRAVLRSLSGDEERVAFEGDASSALRQIEGELSEEARHFWRANRRIAIRGFQQSGVVEQSMRNAMPLFFWMVKSKRNVTAFLELGEPEIQQALLPKRWANWRWRAVFTLAFHPWLLGAVYGVNVIRRLPPDAGDLVRDNLETALTLSPARGNGYLWQTFLHRYPAGDDGARPVYLQAAKIEQTKQRLHSMRLHCADVASWLKEQPEQSIDFFALSNILELAPADFAASLAEQIVRTAAPGAVVVTRQIFAGPAPLHHPGLLLDSDASARLDALDRSPICRHFRLYRVR